MPKFATISPTHISGKKEEAWKHFREGGYVAIGAFICEDLSGKTINEIKEIIRTAPQYSEKDIKQKTREYVSFFSLVIGDYVAVNNTNSGLFGIGVITSDYRFKEHAHDTGSTDPNEFYCHFRDVKWLVASYLKRKDIINSGEKGWAPYGIIHVVAGVPDYIMRVIEKNK